MPVLTQVPIAQAGIKKWLVHWHLCNRVVGMPEYVTSICLGPHTVTHLRLGATCSSRQRRTRRSVAVTTSCVVVVELPHQPGSHGKM